jgi:hypothetical protein
MPTGTQGVGSEISTQEILNNTGGTPTACFYTPAAGVSAASEGGLRAGVWQITLTHSVPGYPNPVVCTRQLALGGNAIAFLIEPQSAGCQ